MELFVADVGHDDRPGHLVDAQLRSRVELPDGLDFVPEELDAERVVEGVGKHIDDAATDCVSAWFIDKIDLVKAVFDEDLVDEVHGVGFARGNRERRGGKFLAADDLLGDRFGEGHDDQSLALGVDFVEDLGALGDVGVLGDFFLVGHTSRTGKKEHGSAPVEELLEVVQEVGRRFLVVEDEEVASRGFT